MAADSFSEFEALELFLIYVRFSRQMLGLFSDVQTDTFNFSEFQVGLNGKMGVLKNGIKIGINGL